MKFFLLQNKQNKPCSSEALFDTLVIVFALPLLPRKWQLFKHHLFQTLLQQFQRLAPMLGKLLIHSWKAIAADTEFLDRRGPILYLGLLILIGLLSINLSIVSTIMQCEPFDMMQTMILFGLCHVLAIRVKGW